VAIVTRKESLHHTIVNKILPRIAKKLKQEGSISDSNRKQFKIPVLEELEPFTITPDRVLQLPDGKKVLVEVANPTDPKRFIGELVYPKILTERKEIQAFFMFVLNPEDRRKHTRSLTQTMIVSQLIGKYRYRLVTWPNDEEAAYKWLKDFITGLCKPNLQ
jgi:hypothetical protein